MSPRPPITRPIQELRATLKLAAPLAVAQLAQVAMGATDTIMLGSLGSDALAAGGLGANLFFTLMLVVSGLLITVSIVVSHARGAGQPDRIAKALRAGIVLAAPAAALPMLALWHTQSFLRIIGEPEQLARSIGAYDRVLLWAMPAALVMAALRGYLAAMGRPWLVMVVATGGVVINGFLNYGLIHGVFGLPQMGFIGSATATLITVTGMAAVIGLSMRAIPELRRYRLLGPVDWTVMREMATMGWPIALTLGIEILLFTVSGIVIGFFGATALAAHQIALSVAAITFMIPLALSQAANVRVGFHIGAGAPAAARQAGITAFLCGVVFMGAAAAVLVIAPDIIAGLYIGSADPNRPAVLALTARLLVIAAFFQMFDAAQVTANGALRGLEDTRIPALLAGLGYWGVGFTIAWSLGVYFGQGVIGIWWGLAAGLAAVAIMLSWRFWRLSGRLIAGRAAWSPSADRALAHTSIAE